MISDDESEEDDFCVYDIGKFTRRMISSVCVQETPRAEHVCISDLRQHKAEQEELVETKNVLYKQRHSSVETATLSERWGIRVAQAAQTFTVTTKEYMRSALLPLDWKYRVDSMFGHKLFNANLYTDTMDARLIPIHGNQYGQVFTTKDFFVDVYPMNSKDDCGQTLLEFITDYGVMLKLTFDGSKEQTKSVT